MSELIVPGRPTQASRRATLLVPRTALPRYRCVVPIGGGEVCGKAFYEGQETKWTTHVRNCARVHETEIAKASPKVQNPMLHDMSLWDPEWREHVRQEAIIHEDGTWTVPNTDRARQRAINSRPQPDRG